MYSVVAVVCSGLCKSAGGTDVWGDGGGRVFVVAVVW